jgi:hypothetical protein
MNTRYQKEAFVDDPYVHYSGFGSVSGDSLGNGENREVLSTISEKLAFADRVQLDRLAPGIVSGIDMMVEKGYAPQIVVMDGRLRHHEELFNSEDFLRAWSQECEPLNWPGFEHRMEGRIRGVPVFAIDGMPSDNVLVLDLKRLGRWIQYQMESAPGETLWFCPDEIDHEKAAEWVNEFPHLIDTEKGETRDQAIWRLQQQVHLRVLERFEYLVEDALAGIRIQIIGEG